ncbi:MAG: TonB-dependent receptor domain-containing protein [Panacagrimonas sp.]
MRKDIARGSWPLVLLALSLSGQAQGQSDSAEPVADSPAPADAVAEPTPSEAPPLGTIPVDATAEVEPAPAPSASSNRLVEEIVVTAQRREERLQDVPISVQAFSKERLDVLGIQSVQEIQRATPGFTVTSAASFNVVFLRGVGSDAFLPGVDSSVPFYLDGVPLLAAQGTTDTLGRVERVEVLKGPQGTLFGRNATGGTVSIVTPEPNQTFEADVKVELGNYSTRNLVAFANIPLTETLAFNISGFTNERDNIIKNASVGFVPEVYGRGGRLKIRWDALENLSLTLAGNYSETSNNGGIAFQLVRPAPILSGGGLILPADPKLDRKIDIDGDFGAESEGYVVSATLNWNTDIFDTKLIYADQEITPQRVDGPFDGTRRPIADAHGAGFNGKAKQFVEQETVELQFLSNEGTPGSEYVEWVAGLFYLNSLGGFDPIVFNVAPDFFNQILPSFGVNLPLFDGTITDPINELLGTINIPPILGQEGIQLANYGLIDSESISVFAQGTFHLIESVDLTTGIRYQDEKRKLLGSRTSFLLDNNTEIVLPLPQGGKETLTPNQTSARVALQWRPFGPDDQIYVSWARALKNPTYNTVNVTGNLFGTMVPLKAERVDTYELGIKTELLDGNLQLNAATFYTIQKNPLSANVGIISGGIANFTNAGEAEIKGADGDFLLIPMPSLNPGLVITGGVSYLDAIYTEFENGRGYDDVTGIGFGNGGASLPPRDLSGKRIPRVPEWSYQAAINQRITLDSGNAFEIGVDTFYTSKIYFLPQNSEFSVRDPTTLFNARLSYFHTAWGLELTAYINNITDEIYADSAFVTDFGTALLVNEDPRLYGLRMKLAF